jgi:acyl-coenzyme A thioesterase PaaI-like protein
MKRPPLPKSDSTRLQILRGRVHSRCVVCGSANPLGLGLHFTVADDGGVEGSFAGSKVFEGYPGRLHGGLIAALLDGAMTNCLFAHGCEAVTAELTVRYRHPVMPAERMTLRAWLTESHEPLHLLRAELRQDDQVKATALGKFLQSHE